MEAGEGRTKWMAGTVDKPIVVGVDRSSAARAALDWALDEALVRDCTVRAVHVWAVDLAKEPPWQPVERIRQRHARQLEETIAEITRGRERVPRIEPVVLEATPAVGLIEAAKDAAMLVVARRSGRWVRRALLGSVSSACVKHASVPVVVIPPTGTDDADEWLVDEQAPAASAGA
ncbi:universal stress protein [Saccharomonospora sp. NB11]|uniref:universal stress protein n=1 Tax=Saccharomonospora sp. NB11 TaxID=1642298 RepID=UPI0027DD0095|nr:universal stress protein [Saccharomonospora sp. NB11]